MRALLVVAALVAAALTLTGQPAECVGRCQSIQCLELADCEDGCDACMIEAGDTWGRCVQLAR